MKEFERQLMVIDAACRANFKQSEGAETEEIDREYVKLREDAVAFYASAVKCVSSKDKARFKALIMDFLCRNAGCQLDVDVLDNVSSEILSEKDREFIFRNSALGRWM